MFRHLWQPTEYWRVLWNAMGMRYGNIIRTQAKIEINKNRFKTECPETSSTILGTWRTTVHPKEILSQRTGIFKKKRCYGFSHTRQRSDGIYITF